MRCPEYVPNISNGAKYEPHPIDPLRGDFNHHVVGPLSHVVVVRTLDVIGNDFRSSLQRSLGSKIRKAAAESSQDHGRYAVSLITALTRELKTAAGTYFDNQENPVSGVVTARQMDAIRRFGSTQTHYEALDKVLFDELTTIPNTIDIIAKRHPELELGDPQQLIAFLRDPETPSIFRGFGTGGSAFIDGFRFNHHPATQPWKRDPAKPILDTSGKVRRTTKELRDAAQRSREINAALLDHPLSMDEMLQVGHYGLFGSAKADSDGCPARHLKFRTDIPSLVNNDLALSTNQVNSLMTLTTSPVIARTDDTTYEIVRDSYVKGSKFLAGALEILAGKK